MLAETLGKGGFGYTSTAADKDVWIKREVLPGEKDYYSMLSVFVDYILCIYKNPLVVIDDLESIYVIQQGSTGPPDRYLGATINKVQT